MCSVQEEGDTKPEPKPSVVKGQTCKKCDASAIVITKIKDAYCRDCFVTYCVHKLRSAFGKSKVVRDGENVLLAYSGGAASTTLQHLIQEGKSERTQRKLRFTPALVYIDESAIVDDDAQQSQSWAIVEKMKETQLTCYYYRIEQVFEPVLAKQSVPTSLEDYMSSLTLQETTENREKLRNLFAGVKSLTAKESLFHSLRQELLLRVSVCLGYSKVLVGDTASRLTVRLLANMTQGRGAHTPLNMTFHDNRHPEVSILRPMREFTSKEVAMYNRILSLEPIIVPSLATKASPFASLEKLTEEFVTGLQAGYPNTVSTIFRTGEKMALNEAPHTDTTSCSLCHAPLDTNPEDACSAMAAIAFSQSLSSSSKSSTNQNAGENQVKMAAKEIGQSDTVLTNEKLGRCDTVSANGSCCKDDGKDGEEKKSGECCGEGDGSCRTTQKQARLSREELCEALCYGCRLVVHEMRDSSDLPSSVHEDAAKLKRRNEMKASIEEFLLDG